MKYSYGPYNKANEVEQRIRITEGCPNNCPFCYEPMEIKDFGIPDIIRNDVKIIDMNILCKPGALSIINDLGSRKVNNKVVYYDLMCGIDWRFLTQELADALHANRFKKIRFAWDFGFAEQIRMKNTVKMLRKAGYKQTTDIMCFMVCNWKIPFEVNMMKLDLLKIWNVQVSDCWFDNQLPPRVQPVHWTKIQIKEFRNKCRKHNQMVTFGIDPKYKKSKDTQAILF